MFILNSLKYFMVRLCYAFRSIKLNVLKHLDDFYFDNKAYETHDKDRNKFMIFV